MTGDGGIVVAHLGDIDDGGAIRVPAAITGTVDDIAVFNDGGEYYALDDTCSHEDASLSQGWVEDGVVECPLHAGKFCLGDGSVQSMPATSGVACHRVDVVDGEIRVTPATERLAQ